MKVSRPLLCGIAALCIAGAALANDLIIIHFTTPTSMEAGQSFTTNMQVNQAPMNVVITSYPAGLVNTVITVNSTSQAVTVPTNVNAPAGSYYLTATPQGGGTAHSTGSVAVSDSGLD